MTMHNGISADADGPRDPAQSTIAACTEMEAE